MAKQVEYLRKLAIDPAFRPDSTTDEPAHSTTDEPSRFRLPRVRVTKTRLVLLAAIALVTILLVTTGRPPPVGATATNARSGATPRTLSASGYVVATRRATVAAQVTGRIDEILFEEGDFVRRGDVLARIDGRVAAANLAEAEAQDSNAAAAIMAYTAQLREAQLRLQRVSALNQRGFASQATLDETEASVAQLRAQLEQARSQRSANGAQTRQRRLLLDQHVIRAPFDGVITVKNAQVGEVISPISAGGSFTRSGIGTLVAMDSLVVDVDVNEAFIGAVRPGAHAVVVAEAFPGARLGARVASIIPTAQRERSSVRVRLTLDPTDIHLMPEMSVSAEIVTSH